VPAPAEVLGHDGLGSGAGRPRQGRRGERCPSTSGGLLATGGCAYIAAPQTQAVARPASVVRRRGSERGRNWSAQRRRWSVSGAAPMATRGGQRRRSVARRIVLQQPVLAMNRGFAQGPGFFNGWWRGAQIGLVVEQPAREQGASGFLEPLVEQGGDLLPDVSGVVESGELETAEPRCGSLAEILPRKLRDAGRHGYYLLVAERGRTV